MRDESHETRPSGPIEPNFFKRLRTKPALH